MVTLIVAATCVCAITAIAVAIGRGRHQLARRPGVFACHLHSVSQPRLVKRPWPSRWMYAEWTHDVLVIHRGLFVDRVLALPVRFPEGLVEAFAHGGLRTRIGAALTLRLDDDSLVLLVAKHESRALLAGPFLTVAVLATGPRSRSRTQRH
ncbi:MAG: hypothetical protein ACJ735_16940 [Actinomycetes bacterium]